ncbi:acyltransferase [Granulicella sp. S190]|uniref:acyltransferase family protein n=1 Tax=Granulicella sp. S190 TaxID=1747226 RepID=UPI00131B46A8|nr:acyltransferase [Granulicella sp. S190]
MTSGTLPAAAPRFDTVDVLRGLSILAVVLLHTWLRFYLAGYDIRPYMPRMMAHLIFLNGGNGVTVFFAVSGFLITLTSLRRFGSLSAMRAATFYRIRFARIAPLLLLVITILSLLALKHAEGFQFSGKGVPLWRAVAAALTFHLNWLEGRHGFLPANWNVMWSLSVEEMFYLVFPIACICLARLRWGMALFIALLLALVTIGPFARTVWSSNPIWQEESYFGGMDGIALGCMTALLTEFLAKRRVEAWSRAYRSFFLFLQVAGAILFAVIACGPDWLWKLFPTKADFYGTLLAVAACLVMLASVLRQTGGRLSGPNRLTAPLRWYGRHSYEVYLTHEFIVVWGVLLFLHWHPNTSARPGGPAPHQVDLLSMVVWFSGILLLTAPLGWFVSRYFSEPLNRRLRGARPAR